MPRRLLSPKFLLQKSSQLSQCESKVRQFVASKSHFVGIYLQGLQKCSKSKKGIKNPEFHAESFGKVAKSLLKRNYRALHKTVHTALKDEKKHKFLISYANVGEVNPPKVSGQHAC